MTKSNKTIFDTFMSNFYIKEINDEPNNFKYLINYRSYSKYNDYQYQCMHIFAKTKQEAEDIYQGALIVALIQIYNAEKMHRNLLKYAYVDKQTNKLRIRDEYKNKSYDFFLWRHCDVILHHLKQYLEDNGCSSHKLYSTIPDID